MANCTPVTLSNIAVECGTNIGGIKRVYAQNYDTIAGLNISAGKITSITLKTEDGYAPEAAVFDFRKQTGSLSSEYTIDDAAGVRYVTNTLALRFAKMDTAKRTAFMAMAMGELALIVQDNNGKYWYLGSESPVTLTAGTGQTGTAFGDANEYAPTLSDMASEMPMEVSADAVAAFLNVHNEDEQ